MNQIVTAVQTGKLHGGTVELINELHFEFTKQMWELQFDRLDACMDRIERDLKQILWGLIVFGVIIIAGIIAIIAGLVKIIFFPVV